MQTTQKEELLKMGKKGMNVFDYLAVIALIIGGLNWGLTSKLIFKTNLIEWMFGTVFFTQFIYLLIGIASVYGAIRLIFYKR